MRLLSTAIAAATLFLAGCNNDLGITLYQGTAVPMGGDQVVPSKSVAGNGSMNLVYNRTTRVLTYTVSWNSLSGTPAAMHVHGPALKGASGSTIQTVSGFSTAVAGSLTGTLLIDGMVIKEEDLLRGALYFDIHTAANAVGEVRGQILVK
ncbi:MAG: CHRD domain-containing protein [Chitinophagaceae bacterium]|nr:CHRD domain-containing protein [Chitinophagaceae bacterium]